MHNMLKAKNIETSEGHNTRRMQYNAQKGPTVQKSPKTP